MTAVRRKSFPSYYASIYADLKDRANELGYCLSIHGSLAKDLDLLACPWVEEAVTKEKLVKELAMMVNPLIYGDCDIIGNPGEKPHGRIAYTIMLDGHAYIDLSIINGV